MVDEGRSPVSNSIDQSHQGAIFAVFQGQRPVNLPPQPLQDLHKILRWFAGNSHTPGKSPIKVRVSTDHAGHNNFAAGIQRFRLRVFGLKIGRAAHINNGVPFIINRPIRHNLFVCPKSYHGAVCN